jgi:DNA-binding transcriptional MerR regulator
VSTEHHTIGEVLNRLKAEFDDVTISKIRFLESEGLVAPRRSESGYRQFSSADIERLRYVLRSQRDRYLPLRVIKDELSRLDAGLPVELEPAVPPAGTLAAERERALPERGSSATTAPIGIDAGTSGVAEPTRGVAAGELADISLDPEELAQASGLSRAELTALIELGVLPGHAPYDGAMLRVARICAELLRRGLEPRHVRTYRLAAEREATLVSQLIAPLLRQRNPESRRRASSQAEELVELGSRLHALLLEAQLASLLRP